MRKTKKRKLKSGKIKRHKLRKKLGVKKGFGKSWSAPLVTFRVEFNFTDENDDESNEQVHWIECRKLSDEEYRSARNYYNSKHGKWNEKETVESKYMFAYICKYLNDNAEKMQINQAFIYFASHLGNETIRMPIYHLTLEEIRQEDLSDIYCLDAEVVFKKMIWHY